MTTLKAERDPTWVVTHVEHRGCSAPIDKFLAPVAGWGFIWHYGPRDLDSYTMAGAESIFDLQPIFQKIVDLKLAAAESKVVAD